MTCIFDGNTTVTTGCICIMSPRRCNCGLAAQRAGCSRNTQQKKYSVSQRVYSLDVAQEMVDRYKQKGGRLWKSRMVLLSVMGSLAHCSDLPRSARNFTGAVVTNESVGLGGFVNKESLKLVLLGSQKKSDGDVLFDLAARSVG